MPSHRRIRSRPPLASLHLVLFSRAPVAGHTKTRLTPPLTPAQAAAFHAACLNDLLGAARDWAAVRAKRSHIPVTLHLFITPAGSQAAFRAAGVTLPAEATLHNQADAPLGARMERAVRQVQRDAPAPAGVLLCGTDLPLLGAAQWDAAADALAEVDAVFGPTPDGGYYLVATRRDPAGLFPAQGWGGPDVLERSTAAAREAGLKPTLIEDLPDADTAVHLHSILEHPRAAGLSGRASLRLLRELLAG